MTSPQEDDGGEIEWREDRFILMSGKPLGVTISNEGEVESIEEGGQAESLGITAGAWVVEIGGTTDDEGQMTAVDTFEEIQAAMASLVIAGETYLTVVTRREVSIHENGSQDEKVGSEMDQDEDAEELDPELEEMYGGMAEYQLEEPTDDNSDGGSEALPPVPLEAGVHVPATEKVAEAPTGDTDTSATAEKQLMQNRLLLTPTVGSSVEARFGGDVDWFPGVVSKVNEENGTLDIDYDDGDKEVGVPSALVRLPGSEVSFAEASAAALLSRPRGQGDSDGESSLTQPDSLFFTWSAEKQVVVVEAARDDYYDDEDDDSETKMEPRSSKKAAPEGGENWVAGTMTEGGGTVRVPTPLVQSNEQGAKRAAGQREGPLHFVPNRVAFWRSDKHSASSSSGGGGGKKVDAGLADLKLFLSQCGFDEGGRSFESLVGFGVKRVEELDDEALVTNDELQRLLPGNVTTVRVRKLRRFVHQWLATGEVHDDGDDDGGGSGHGGSSSKNPFKGARGWCSGGSAGSSSSGSVGGGMSGAPSPAAVMATPTTPTATTPKSSSSSSLSSASSGSSKKGGKSPKGGGGGKLTFWERSRQREEERKAGLEAKKRKFEAEEDRELYGTPKFSTGSRSRSFSSGQQTKKGSAGARMHDQAHKARAAQERRKALEEAKVAKSVGTPKISARGRKASAKSFSEESAATKAAALKMKQDELFTKTHSAQPRKFTSSYKKGNGTRDDDEAGGGIATLYPTKDDRRQAELKMQRKADAMVNKHPFAPKITPKAAKGQLKGSDDNGYDDDALSRPAHVRGYEIDTTARLRKEKRKEELVRLEKEKALDDVGADGRTVREVLKDQQKRKGKHKSAKEQREREQREREEGKREEQRRGQEAQRAQNELAESAAAKQTDLEAKRAAAAEAVEVEAAEEEANRRRRQLERATATHIPASSAQRQKELEALESMAIREPGARPSALAKAQEPALPPPPIGGSGDDDRRPPAWLLGGGSGGGDGEGGGGSAEVDLLRDTLEAAGPEGSGGAREGSVPRDTRGSFGSSTDGGGASSSGGGIGGRISRASFSLFGKKKEGAGPSEAAGESTPQYQPPEAQGTSL